MKKKIIFGGILMLCLGVFTLNSICNNEMDSLLYQNIEALAQNDSDSDSSIAYIPCIKSEGSVCHITLFLCEGPPVQKTVENHKYFESPK